MYLTFSEFTNLSSTLITNAMTEAEYNKIVSLIDTSYINNQLSPFYKTPFHKVSSLNSVTSNFTNPGYTEVYSINSLYELKDTTLTFTSATQYSISPYTGTGLVEASKSIYTDTVNLFTIYLHAPEDQVTGDTVVIDFTYNYPPLIQNIVFNYITWYYLRSYYTQTTPETSEWVDGYKKTADDFILNIQKGLLGITGHKRIAGSSNLPLIGEGSLNV